MPNRDTTSETEIEEFTPTKDTYISLKSDVDLKLAIQELIDNALDAWERHSSRDDSTTIEISTAQTGSRTKLTLKDDAGGVPRDEAAVLFALGRSADSDVAGSIGTYGLGAKKSLVNLGVPFTIASWHPDEANGWEFRITEEWLRDDDDWGVEISTTDRVDPGETLIQIEDLNYSWDAETANELRSELAHTYNLFLDDSLDTQSYNLRIVVDGKEVEPPGLPDWSYSPFDGIAPRRFENIELDLETVEEPIRLHVTVGLLRKKDGQLAGTDIYCQNRKVVTASRDEVGGYGSGQSRLGNFTVHHQRLKVLVELETEGEADALPWDTQKASINRHTEVMQATYKWLHRIAKPYFDMTDNVVPRAFVEFYPRESEYAANAGEVRVHDYSERKRMSAHHKPETSAPEISELRGTARAHVEAGFRCYAAIEDWQRPAYEGQLTAELGSETDYTDLPIVDGDTPLKGFDESRAMELKEDVVKLAKDHARRGVRYTEELFPWQETIYETYMETSVDGKLETRDTVSADVPTTPADLGQMQSKDENEANGSSETGDAGDTEPESDVQPSDTSFGEQAELALILEDGEQELVGTLVKDDRQKLAERLGLSADADPDELYSELQRRLELLIEFE